MSKKFYLIPLIFIAAVFITAFAARASYKNDGEKFYDYNYNSMYDGSQKAMLSDMGFSSLDKIADKSELIVRCRALPGRIITDSAFFTPVKILGVYKGDKSFNGRTLQIVESISKQAKYNELDGDFGSVPLFSGDDYVLCLSKRKWPGEKVLSDYENSEYYVTSLSAFGAFRTGNDNKTRLIASAQNGYTINKLRGFEIMTNRKEMLSQYNALKKALFSRYKISRD